MKKPKVIIKKGVQFYWVVVKGRNGEPLMTSELLNNRADAVNNINATYEVLKEYVESKKTPLSESKR